MAEVILLEYNKHILKYVVETPNIENDDFTPDYVYFFVEHDRWVRVNWAQNISDRHRLIGQRNIYLQKI